MADRVYSALLFLAALGCASAMKRPTGDVDAMLSRGGGIAGLSETVHVWSSGGVSQGIYARSDRPESRALQLPKRTLDSSLVALESLVERVPQLPPDTGAIRHVCADMILLRIEVRHAGRTDTAQEECPHRTRESEMYWQRVDSLFHVFVAGAR
ncbi:MAG TPA: hypothetical protein VHL32_11835 [Gemmatimonadaceae bacterium]|nr:hypothetical protein [Gemmatimonadaceae bacterium]